MAKKKSKCYSGIGGQAVLEGVMMKNKDKYAVAVRRPDGGISVEVDNYQGVLSGNKIKEIPFIRGIFNFVDSLVLGMKCLNYSASFYEEEDGEGVIFQTRCSISIAEALKGFMTLSAQGCQHLPSIGCFKIINRLHDFNHIHRIPDDPYNIIQ